VPVSLGSCALVEAAGIDVLLNSVRSQAINTAMFTQLGCDLMGKQIVVVKSAQHF
jgi:microcystin degradation protein MlrC